MNQENEEDFDMSFLEKEAEKALENLALLEKDIDNISEIKGGSISSVSLPQDSIPSSPAPSVTQESSVNLDDVEHEGLNVLVGLSRQLDSIANRLTPEELGNIQSAFGSLTRFVLKKKSEPPAETTHLPNVGGLDNLNYPIEPYVDPNKLNKRYIDETSKIYEAHIKKLEDYIVSIEKQLNFNKKNYLTNEKNLNLKIQKLIQYNKKLAKCNNDDITLISNLNKKIHELSINIDDLTNNNESLTNKLKNMSEDSIKREGFLIKKYENQISLVKKSLHIMKKVNEQLLKNSSSSPTKKLSNSSTFIGIADICSDSKENNSDFSPNSSSLSSMYFKHKQQSSTLFMRLTDRLLSLKHNTSKLNSSSGNIMQKSISFNEIIQQNNILDGMIKILQEELTVSSTFLEALLPIIQDKKDLNENFTSNISSELLSSKYYEDILKPLIDISMKAQIDCVESLEKIQQNQAQINLSFTPSSNNTSFEQDQRGEQSSTPIQSLNQSISSFTSIKDKKNLYNDRNIIRSRSRSTPPRSVHDSLNSTSLSLSSTSPIRSIRSLPKTNKTNPPTQQLLKKRLVYTEKDSILSPSNINNFENTLLNKRQENFFDHQISLWENNKIFLDNKDEKLLNFINYFKNLMREIDINIENGNIKNQENKREDEHVSLLVNEATNLISDINCIMSETIENNQQYSPTTLTTLSSPRPSNEPFFSLSTSKSTSPLPKSESLLSESNFTFTLLLRNLNRIKEKLNNQECSNNFFSLLDDNQNPFLMNDIKSQENIFNRSFSISPRFLNVEKLNTKKLNSWKDFINPEANTSENQYSIDISHVKDLNDLLEQLKPRENISLEEFDNNFKEIISNSRAKISESSISSLNEFNEFNKNFIKSYNNLINERNFFLNSLNLLSKQNKLIKENYKNEIYLTVKTIWDIRNELNSLEIENSKLHEKLKKFYSINDKLINYYNKNKAIISAVKSNFNISEYFNPNLISKISEANNIQQILTLLSTSFHTLYKDFVSFNDHIIEQKNKKNDDLLNNSLNDISFSQHNLSFSSNNGSFNDPLLSGIKYDNDDEDLTIDSKEDVMINKNYFSIENFNNFLCMMMQILEISNSKPNNEEKLKDQIKLLELKLTSSNNSLLTLQKEYDELKLKNLDDDISMLNLKNKINETINDCETSFNLKNSNDTKPSSLINSEKFNVSEVDKIDQLRQYINSMKNEYEKLKDTIINQREVIDRKEKSPLYSPNYLSDLKFISETSTNNNSPILNSMNNFNSSNVNMNTLYNKTSLDFSQIDQDYTLLFKLDFNLINNIDDLKLLLQKYQLNLFYLNNKYQKLENTFHSSSSSSAILSQANNKFLINKYQTKIKNLTNYYTNIINNLNNNSIELKNFLAIEKNETNMLKKKISELNLTIHQLTHHLKLLQCKSERENFNIDLSKKDLFNSTTSLLNPNLNISKNLNNNEMLLNMSHNSLNLSQLNKDKWKDNTNFNGPLNLNLINDEDEDDFYLSETLKESLKETLGKEFHEEAMKDFSNLKEKSIPSPLQHTSLVFPNNDDLSSIHHNHSNFNNSSNLFQNKSINF